jgi:NAD(P)-dependent dehydrogenase (short-subunit alcohol dehydrogenase family)
LAALDGRVSLVTGGSTGIGRTVAIALASQGTPVVISYRRSAADAEQVVATILGFDKTIPGRVPSGLQVGGDLDR